MTRVGAVLLAAGTASRFRAADPSLSTTLVARVGGGALVRRAAEAALASRAAPLVVVTGHAAPDVMAALDGVPLIRAHNPDYAGGMASSLRTGLGALPQDADGALVLLGDMPGITAALLDGLLAAFAGEPGCDAVVPVFAGRRGNPALLARGLFGPAMRLEGDEGARRLLARAHVVEVDCDDGAVLLDVDTPTSLASSPVEPR